jgi:acetate kinase
MAILVFNAGSTSLKFGIFTSSAGDALAGGEIDWADNNRREAKLVVRASDPSLSSSSRVAVPTARTAVHCALEGLGPILKAGSSTIQAVGHRVVHGGAEFHESVLIDSRVKTGIRRLSNLAPLHNPPALEAIETAEESLPGVPQVAVFDTTFFAHLPPKAYVYPLPYEWHTEWGIRRFGFHGISHAYCASRAVELLGRGPGGLRIVSCHVGGGCSATATQDGVAVATTLGFSPLDGLMMGTRCGALDPGILIHLQREVGISLAEIERALNYSSGLLGVSGVAPDHAKVELAAAQGNERARLAFDMFADRVRAAIGSLAVTMGGLDALLFTAGVGTKSPLFRTAACTGLECLGVHLDPARNQACQPDQDIAAAHSKARVFVIDTREAMMIAREVRRVALARVDPSVQGTTPRFRNRATEP